ncbi:hypothetical protein UVI_02001420 [Ustilaginoidea virens]|uniref:Uncharacterized protein n=1 Tax=Ustilaginoidea virens TaxID=1159556 RepID=A0A1B5KTG5_USTVR|nr:hypothetical protein UVI_02001420 [Ustilaginoidea virens]
MSASDDEEPQMSASDAENPQMSANDDDEPPMSASDDDEPQMSANDDEEPQMSASDDDEPQMSASDDKARPPPPSQSHFSKFDNFTPDDDASFDHEFARLASSQDWAPGSQEYTQERTIAMREELKLHYFSQPQPLSDIDEELTEEEKLQGYQDLCREVRIPPSDSIAECKRLLKSTLVNIVDLIDARRMRKEVKGQYGGGEKGWGVPGIIAAAPRGGKAGRQQQQQQKKKKKKREEGWPAFWSDFRAGAQGATLISKTHEAPNRPGDSGWPRAISFWQYTEPKRDIGESSEAKVFFRLCMIKTAASHLGQASM